MLLLKNERIVFIQLLNSMFKYAKLKEVDKIALRSNPIF